MVISGQVAVGTTGLAGATVTFTPGTTATTDANGNYTMTLLSGWSGTAVASKAGYYITPLSLAFTNVTVDQINQNFVAVNAITIYGLVSQNTVPATPLAGVTLTFSNGGGTAVTDAAGIYTQYTSHRLDRHHHAFESDLCLHADHQVLHQCHPEPGRPEFHRAGCGHR